jgi:hypothetical protein
MALTTAIVASEILRRPRANVRVAAANFALAARRG